MKIETVALEDQQTKLIAELDTETLEKYMHQAARKISQSAKIPGFRPGKAPYDMIRRMYGDEKLQQEAIELMMEDVYPQILKEADLNPSGPGKLDEVLSINPPKFSFIVPLQPEVALGDYKSIREDYQPVEVTEDQIEETLRRLLRSYSTAEPVERASEKGDMVSFTLSARRTQPSEEKPETLVEETPYQMVAGEEDQDQEAVWPYEGFTNELIGLSADEIKTFIHTFGDESPYEDLRGEEAEFTIIVQNIKKLDLPELTDEFAQTLGEFENVDSVRKAIRTQLEQNSRQQYDQNYFEGIVSQLVDQATVKYPPHMVEDEVEQFLAGVEHNLEHDQLDLDTYLKMREMDRETFIEQEVKPAAVRRLVRSLVMEEFAKQEKVEVKSDEIRSIYYSALQQMQKSPDLRKAQGQNKQTPQEMANELAMSTVNSIFNQRLVNRLKAIATGKGDEQPEEMVMDQESEFILDPAIVDAPTDEADAQESSVQETVVEEPVANEPVTEEPAVDAPAADEEEPKA